MGSNREAGRRRRRRRYREGRPESKGGPAPGRRHRQNACDPAGDLVREGQVLATLDDVQIKAELLIVRSQLGEAMGRQARLIAERDNLRSIEFPAELGRVSTPRTS